MVEVINLKLTKDAEKVLNLIINSEPNLQGRFYAINCIDEKLPNMDTRTVLMILRELDRQDLIKFDSSRTVFTLCEPGRNYKEYQSIDRREFWMKSIWTPILVAFVTTLITAHALPLLINWLIAMLQSKP